jgi:hypothetical protein
MAAREKMDQAQKDLLAPFADAYAELDQRLAGKTAAELRALKKACGSVSASNCWAATYRAAKIIEPLIDAWLRHAR